MMTMDGASMIAKNVSLKHVNTFGVDVNANYFSAFHNADQLIELLSIDELLHLPTLILGGGSNVLFTKNYAGLVLQNVIKGITVESEDEHHVWIRVGAGENWHQFVMDCVEKNLGGVENLSLIPGTVGAAPIQNIGAYGVELSSVLVEVQALKLSDRCIHIFNNQDCYFGYRDSIFKTTHKGQYVILSVLLRLDKTPTLHLEYGAVKDTLKALNRSNITIKDVSDAVIEIRCSKLPDPGVLGNAGSFFKNPVITRSQLLLVQKQFPDIPNFAVANADTVKINAGWLIEQCGWKGKRVGNVGAYEKQALIIVNYGNASGADIYDFAMQIQSSVQTKFGITLESEVNMIG